MPQWFAITCFSLGLISGLFGFVAIRRASIEGGLLILMSTLGLAVHIIPHPPIMLNDLVMVMGVAWAIAVLLGIFRTVQGRTA